MNEFLTEARSILTNLSVASGDLELALYRETQARRVAVETKRTYEDAEVEVVAEAMFTADAKNAEGRKAQVDVALVRSRTGGALAQPYAMMLAADGDWQNAKMALDQCSKRYRSIEAAAELSSSILRAVAGR